MNKIILVGDSKTWLYNIKNKIDINYGLYPGTYYTKYNYDGYRYIISDNGIMDWDYATHAIIFCNPNIWKVEHWKSLIIDKCGPKVSIYVHSQDQNPLSPLKYFSKKFIVCLVDRFLNNDLVRTIYKFL